MLANLYAVIAAGESLSEAIDCSGGQLVRITLPDNYTEADTPIMSFQASADGVAFHDFVNDEGQQIVITARKDTTILVMQPWTRAIGHLKVRSGSKDNPKPQDEECTVAVSLMPSTSVVFAGGGAVISESPPEGVADGTIWWDSKDGPSAAKRLYVKYFDGSSSQWVGAET